jgi:transposase-like protein
MSPRKLTDGNKQEILNLYRQSEETTSTLAVRYGVSSSTISRFLKNHLSDLEYEDLIQQKRLARTTKNAEEEEFALDLDLEISQLPEVSLISESAESLTTIGGRKRRRSAIDAVEVEEQPINIVSIKPVTVASVKTVFTETETTAIDVLLEDQDDDEQEKKIESMNVVTLREILDEDLEVEEDDEEDDEDLDEDDDEDWDDDEEDDLDEDDDEIDSTPHWHTNKNVQIQVLPLSEAAFPQTCYLVIDRVSELITRPLKEFGDLGSIPEGEFQQRTLPVFDNHRVARRFSNRSQRVIKVPDGRLLKKTSPYLEAKGITRLLLDGQIYSLS